MQDVSRVVGETIVIRPSAKDRREYIVRGVTFEDLGFLQDRVLEEKRKAKVESAKLAMELCGSSGEREKLQNTVRGEMEKIAYLSMEELFGYIASERGMVTFLWSLLERQYSGEFTRESVYQMILDQEISPEQIAKMIESLTGSPQGNSIGQRAASPTKSESQDGVTPSGYSRSRSKRAGSASGQRRKN